MSSSGVNLHELMQRVRDAIGGRDFVTVSLSRLEFAHVCAAADALQDAEEALFDFHASDSGVNGSYLRLYGVLQAAQLQQDCIDVLRQAFLLPALEVLPAGMRKIRDLRNRSCGHPAEPNAKRRSKSPATAIARFSLEGGDLEFWCTQPSGEVVHERVDLPAELEAHSADIVRLLTDLVAEIVAKEDAFKAGQRRLCAASALLHPTWSYLLGKVRTEAREDGRSGGALRAYAGMLADCLDEVVSGLAKRGLRPVYDWHVDTARASLVRLAELADRLAEGEDVALDIDAFAELTEKHFRDVAAHLSAVDQRLQESK